MTEELDRMMKHQTLLSPTTRVTLYFEGESPDEQCFANLRAQLDLMEQSLLGTVRPCTKHPDAERYPRSRRCMECVKERGKSKRQLKAV